MKIVNCTPHAINVILSNGEVVTIPKGDVVARVAVTAEFVADFCGVPLTRTSYGEVQDLPDPVEGTLYLVSMFLRSAVPHRKDVASPGEMVRDNDGNIVGCRGLVVN